MAAIKTILGTDTVSSSRLILNENFASINQQLSEFSQLLDTIEAGSGGSSFNGIVTTNIIPNQNEEFDLGSPTRRFKDIYLSNNTIYLGENSMRMANGNLLVNGNQMATNSRILEEAAERARLLGIETAARTQAISSISSQINSLSDSNSAFAQALTNINTSFESEINDAVYGETLARIEAVSNINQTLTSLSNANEAFAESVNELSTSFTTEINDAVGAETTARTEALSTINETLTSLTDENSALAESITAIEAQYTITDGSITGFSRSSALKNEIDLAIATANDATVSSTTELIAELGDQTSEVTQTMSASIDALTNKVNAQYTLEVDANGNVAGMKLAADETGSEISFTADSFKVSTGGPQGQILTPFSIVNGQVAFNGAVSFSEGPQGPSGPQGVAGTNGLNGLDGVNGLPGAKGVDGVSTYFHVAYADTASGGGFSQNPTGKFYIGTYVDSTSADAAAGSSLWKWQLIKGADGTNGENGIAGTNGTNGQTSYLHIAYANNSSGTSGFSTTDSTGKLYIGQYTDFTLADSSNPALYSWTLIKGETGATGPQGPAPDTSQFLTTSTTIDGGKITTGIIKNGNFQVANSNWDTYSTAGMGINLDKGAINSKNFYIDQAGNAKFRGDIDITAGATVGGTQMGDFFEVADDPDSVAPRKFLRMKDDAYIGTTKFTSFKRDVGIIESNLYTYRNDFDLIADDYVSYKGGSDPRIPNPYTTLSHMYIKRNDVTLEIGDLVKLDENNELVKAASAKDPAIVGILWDAVDFSIQESPLDKFLINGKDISEKPHHYRDSLGNKIPVNDRDQKSIWRVAALGDSIDAESGLQGMKVCNQNGPILKGDLLCSSDIPGYAMKQPVEYVITGFNNDTPQYEERQTINSFTLGKCMEDCAFDSEGKATGIYGYIYCG
jgi:hypothetical protein